MGAEVPFRILFERHNHELLRFCAFDCWRYRIARRDMHMIEQFVEESWLRLEKRHQTLAGFDLKRGTFPGYMRALVRDAIAQHRRSGQRKLRETSEFEHVNQPVDRVVPGELWLADFHEFGATLHGAVKRYWDEVVLQKATPPGIKALSPVNQRFLKSQLWALFEKYAGA